MPKEKKKRKIESENFRLFYQIQYDRIDKLETKRENFCNYIITISSTLLVFGLNNSNENKSLLLLFIIIINILAIVFIDKTRLWVNMHQERAKEASAKYAIEFNEIKDSVGKAESDNDTFRRSRIYSYVHGLIILTSIIFLLIENRLFCLCG
nr:hypothetical protein [uncultured Flavobacterium sp.]